MSRGVPAGKLTGFIEVGGVLLAEESGVEDEGPLDDNVGEAGERPPAHEQTGPSWITRGTFLQISSHQPASGMS